jgi:hypothetical protein
VDVDQLIVVGLDAYYKRLRVYEAAVAALKLSKEVPCVMKQRLKLIRNGDLHIEYELSKINVHEQLCTERVQVAGIG